MVWVLLSIFCIASLGDCMHPQHQETTIILRFFSICFTIKAYLHGGGGPQIGEVICGWSPHLSCKRDKIKMRENVDRRVTQQSGLPHPPGVPHLHVNRPLGPVYMEVGDPGLVGLVSFVFTLWGHKTKETCPTRPGSPTLCKQGLSACLHGVGDPV